MTAIISRAPAAGATGHASSTDPNGGGAKPKAPSFSKPVYSDQDVRDVFSTLACQAATIRDSLVSLDVMMSDADCGMLKLQMVAHQIRLGVELMGSVADHMSGGAVVGCPATWATHQRIDPLEGGVQ